MITYCTLYLQQGPHSHPHSTEAFLIKEFNIYRIIGKSKIKIIILLVIAESRQR